MSDKYICHFSCGSTSAIAAMIIYMNNPDTTELLYTDPGMEHKDNHRFMRDIEQAMGTKVTVLVNDKFKHPFEVFKDRKFLCSPQGAPCTMILKKKTMNDYLGDRLVLEKQVLGFTANEQGRIDKYAANYPEIKLVCPLVNAGLSKEDCIYILNKLGIKTPAMYDLGYKNANCTGCVKAESIGYWAAIREDFPNIFNWYAKFERTIGRLEVGVMRVKHRGVAINKKYIKGVRHRVFLDEIPKDFKPKRNISWSCNGLMCSADQMDLFEEADIIIDENIANRNMWLNTLKSYYFGLINTCK